MYTNINILAPAKINLGLRIINKREDGYHNILSIMQPLSITDEIVIEKGAKKLIFTCNIPTIKKNNLIKKVVQFYYKKLGSDLDVKIHLIKRIPIAAGLGGGSSDAAAALLGLNILNNNFLSSEQLYLIAKKTGADVSFFLGGMTALASGFGEQVQFLPDFPLLNYVLINPGFAVSTTWAYTQFDLSKIKSKGYIKERINQPITLNDIMFNDLEKIVFRAYPELIEIKKILFKAGAYFAMMSGSGPTIYGLFKENLQAVEVANQLAASNKWRWVRACRGINQ